MSQFRSVSTLPSDRGGGITSMQHSFIARRELTVEHENGLHIVPCSAIVKAVQGFSGAVRISRTDPVFVADAASVFDLLGLQAEKGTCLTLEAEGEHADEVLDRLVALFANGFDVRR